MIKRKKIKNIKIGYNREVRSIKQKACSLRKINKIDNIQVAKDIGKMNILKH